VKTSASTTGTEEAALQQAAVQQRQRVLEGLRKAPVSGRLVIHLRPDRKTLRFAGRHRARAGDWLTVPKQPGEVLVTGQVYNSNALTIHPEGMQAGISPAREAQRNLLTKEQSSLSVLTALSPRKQGGFWSGSVLSATMVRATRSWCRRASLGSTTLKNVIALAQIASSAALVAAVVHP